ncbi:MAG: FtsX-like permease family protein [Thermoplasmata archaeon]|nr:MAG: FtsX-like permease family protein [Thermoplasmata archaeon]
MVAAILKKSWNDLKIRKSRTFFVLLTIALSVSGLSMFAVMPLMDQAMVDEIEKSNMYDLRLGFNNLELAETNLNDIENIDNVKSVEGKYVFFTRIYIGERRNDAIFVGVSDFNNQAVDIVSISSGREPGYFQVLTDSGNSRSNLYSGKAGDTVRAYNSTGQVVELEITGEGHTLSIEHSSHGIAVFFANLETVHALAEGKGYNYITLDLEDASEAEAEQTVEDVRSYLSDNTEFVAFTQLPVIREEGDWPGKDELADLASFFIILTLLAMFCSLFLISNTMHTLVAEQRKDIAQMKAIGATRKQVVKSYLTTSMIIGLIGSIIGIILGVIIAFEIEQFFLGSFYGVQSSFAIHLQTVLLSIFIGISITVLATLPALYKALKITVREGMEGVALTRNGSSGLHKSLLRFNSLPRSTQMGIRNISRKKGRSVSTIIQIALAVGIFLSIVSIGISINMMIADEFDNFTYDIMTIGQTNDGKPLEQDLELVLEDIDGVAEAEPFIITAGQLDDQTVLCFGYVHDTISFNYEDTHYKGRWFNQHESDTNASVIVLGKALARIEGISLGDNIHMELATGLHEFEVIGLNSGQMNNGLVAYMPFSSLQEKLLWNNTVTGFTIVTDSRDHDTIDSVSTEIEDELLSSGFVADNEIMYVMEEQNKKDVNQIMNLMMAVGSLIIIITMIGLMSTLTMNVLERTKEICMMRCLGSKSGHIKSVFGTEGIILGLIGWVIGIPLGYGIGLFLNHRIYTSMNLDMTYIFPMNYILISLVLTVIISLVVIQPPLWRATHFKPGDALRYE